MRKIYRQGDVGIQEIKKLPKGLRVINSPIIKEGEATGHHHKLVKEYNGQFDVLEDLAGQKYLQINEPTDLTHQEHKTITIERGLYFISHEREYNYFELEARKVVD